MYVGTELFALMNGVMTMKEKSSGESSRPDSKPPQISLNLDKMNDRFKFRAWNKGKMEYAEFFRLPVAWYNRKLKNQPAVIMQSTGGYDLNHRLIFEKDILRVRYSGTLLAVFWGKQCWRLKELKKGNQKYEELTLLGEYADPEGDLEIIGNIYEHPDLLTPKST